MARFTMRDLLWFVALMGITAAWYADHRRQDERIRQQKAASAQAAAQVQAEWLNRYQGEGPPP